MYKKLALLLLSLFSSLSAYSITPFYVSAELGGAINKVHDNLIYNKRVIEGTNISGALSMGADLTPIRPEVGG